jgi:hypothetical protein
MNQPSSLNFKAKADAMQIRVRVLLAQWTDCSGVRAAVNISGARDVSCVSVCKMEESQKNQFRTAPAVVRDPEASSS